MTNGEKYIERLLNWYKEAVTEDGAVENRTRMADMEIPMTPITIITIGCFSKYFISLPL
jgi:hypothetical protein